MSTHVSSDDLKRYFLKDKFAVYIGIELINAGDGKAKARLEIKPHHLNGVGIVHGGVTYTLADLAFAAAVNSRGHVALAISNTISYVKAPKGTVIFAEAAEVSTGQRLATYTVNVIDEEGEIVCVFQGMAYKKSQKVDYFETA
jgi:acyl-CoA thioesterase